jgi:uncharacterized membrane protein YtjA (UPF0391 family)
MFFVKIIKNNIRNKNMFMKLALILGFVAVIAGLFGFTGIAAGSAGIAKALFMISIIGAVIFAILGFLIV